MHTHDSPSARRWALAGAIGLVAAGVAVTWATYPGVGRLTYRTAAAIETRLRGLHRRSIAVDGSPVGYLEGGPAQAPTVVLLHGFTADSDVWVRFAHHLLPDYHVLIPDLAGHGRTGYIPGADYSAPAQAERVAALLDVLGIDRVHIMGNSMGGFVAAHFAAAQPDRTLSLGLCNAAGVISPVPSDLDLMLEEGHNPFLITDPSQFDALYAMTMASPPYLPRPVLDAKAQDYVDRRDAMSEIFVGHHRRNLLDDELTSITCSTLVQWGAEDPLVDPSAAQVWADGLPDAVPLSYDGVGHMPMVEIPARSAADYGAFLAGVVAGAALAEHREPSLTA